MIRRITAGLLLTAALAPAQPATMQPTTSPTTSPATAPASQPTTRPVIWSDGKPTPLALTIDAENGPEAAAQLSRQLGVPVQIANTTAPIHYTAPERPYARALGDFLDQAGLAPFESGAALSLMPGKPLRVMPMGELGTLVVSRITCNASRSMLQPQAATYSYSVQGVLILDPSMRVLGVSQSAMIDKADLTPAGFRPNGGGGFDNYAVYRALNDQTPSLRLMFNFSTTQPLTRINALTGRLKAWRVVDEASVDVSFEQIAQGQPVEGKGVTAAVAVDPRAGRQGALSVTLTGPVLDLYKEGRWQQGLIRTVTAFDVDGALMPLNVYNAGRPIAVRRNAAGQPDKKDPPQPITLTVRGDMRNGMQASEFFDLLTTLRVRVPTKLKAIDLPFEIRDIDLVSEQK